MNSYKEEEVRKIEKEVLLELEKRLVNREANMDWDKGDRINPHEDDVWLVKQTVSKSFQVGQEVKLKYVLELCDEIFPRLEYWIKQFAMEIKKHNCKKKTGNYCLNCEINIAKGNELCRVQELKQKFQEK